MSMAPDLGCSAMPKEQLFERVSISEVNSENLDVIWPHLLESIRKAQLVSIDLELSGLGERSACTRTLPERYKRIRQAAQTRSILSVGIATFQFNGIDTEQKRELRYKCRVFDLLALEERPFVVEPEALRFLSSHSFNFNRLLTHGIRYIKTDSNGSIFHSLWEELLASGVCLAFHNGLTDLAFLHEHFYVPLPELCDQFTANLADWFGKREAEDDYCAIDCALWDSKYMAENHQTKNFSCSYLDYVFRKTQRDNQRLFQNDKPHLAIKFSKLRVDAQFAAILTISRLNCGLKESFIKGEVASVCRETLCQSYMRFGHCKNRMKCVKAHDVDFLLDLEDKRAQQRREKERKRRGKKEKSEGKSNGGEKEKDDESENESISRDEESSQREGKEEVEGKDGTKRKWEFQSRGCHRAGMDAFMTGFAVLFFQLDHTYRNSGQLDRRLAGCIALPGKDFPLLICKSNFVTQTENHQLNWARVESRRRAFDRAKYEKWTKKARRDDGDAH